jgi:hypothetical protein
MRSRVARPIPRARETEKLFTVASTVRRFFAAKLRNFMMRVARSARRVHL